MTRSRRALDAAEQVLLQQMAREIAALEAAPMEIVLRPQTAIALAGLVQLALRHEGTAGDIQAIGHLFVDSVREYFADAPAVLEVLHKGDDPTEDR